MNLKVFQDRCKSEVTNQVLKENKWDEVKKEQDNYGKNYKPIKNILTYLGWQSPKCPHCGEALKKETISYIDYCEKYILSSSCGYKYAVEFRREH